MCRPPVLKWLVLHTLLMPILAMRVRVHRNPVTRVTDLLERLKDKVEKQGADEAKLWEQMQCNCKKTTTNLQMNIEQEETRLPMLRSDHSALGAQKARLVAEKERAVADRTDAQTALSSAEELRQKEATDYTKLKEETQKNLAAIGKAIAAIEKGLSGSFLQTDEAEELRQVVSTANLRLSDRDALAALLAGEMPQSSSIVGVLQSMRDSMEEDQSSAESREAGAKSAFDGMATAKLSQISTLASEIEVKTSRIGELSVDMVNKQQAMDSSAKKLQDDSKLLADTKETCDQQEEDWQARSQSRADEMHAIQETLSLLGDEQAGDDDAIRALLVEALLCAADAQLAESFLAECEEKGRRAERDGALLEFVFADLDRRAFFQASVTLAAFFADQYSMHEGSDFKLKVVKGAHSVLVAFRSSDYAEAVKQTASALAKLCATGSMSSVAAAAIKDAGDFSPEAEELLVGVRQDAEVLKARPARPECDQALKDAAARARGEAPAISVKTQSALPRAATASAAEERRSQLGRSGRERKGTTVAGGKGGLYTGKGQGKAAAAPGKGDKNGTRVDPDVFKLPKSSAELQRDPEKAKTFQEDLRTFARNFKLSAELVGMDYIQLKPIGFVPHDTKQKAREELRMLLEFHFPSTSRPEPPRPLPTRQTHLRVHPEHGAGIELTVSEQGYWVDFVEDFPGQDLFVGDVILEINGQKLAGLSEAEMEDTFGAHFGDGAKLTIQPPERRGERPKIRGPGVTLFVGKH